MSEPLSAEIDRKPILLLPLPNAESLRDLLDHLNDTGEDYRAVGIDSRGAAFLVTLSGPYADRMVVLYGDPWDGEVAYRDTEACEECAGVFPLDASTLRFPVTVLIRPGRTTPGGAS